MSPNKFICQNKNICYIEFLSFQELAKITGVDSAIDFVTKLLCCGFQLREGSSLTGEQSAKVMNEIDRNLAYPLQLNTGYAILYMYVKPGLGDTLKRHFSAAPLMTAILTLGRSH